PTSSLTVSAQGSYNHAVLTEDLPAAAVAAGAYALSGDRLPYSIPWSGGVTGNQDIPISGDWMGFLGGEITYVATRKGEFAGGALSHPRLPRQVVPGHATANLRTGLHFDSWRFSLYVNNVTDRRGIAGAEFTYATGNRYGAIVQPRTIGLSAVK